MRWTRWDVENAIWRVAGWLMGLGLLVGIWNWAGYGGRHKRLEHELAQLSHDAYTVANILNQSYVEWTAKTVWTDVASYAYLDVSERNKQIQASLKRLERHAGTLPPDDLKDTPTGPR